MASSPWFAESTTPLAVVDCQSRFQGVNPALSKITGRAAEELLGSVVFDAFPDNPMTQARTACGISPRPWSG